jgi:GlpG protein
MRFLTSLADKTQAESFVAYLLTQQISTHVEPASASGEWEVWIRDEDRTEEARLELQRFLAEPHDVRYANAVRSAHQILQEKRKQQQTQARQVKSGRQVFRGNPMASGGLPPITLTLLILSAIVTLLTEFMSPSPNNRFGQTVLDSVGFVSPRDYQLKKDPAANLKKGEIWRLVTPIFPHGSTIHLLFNFLAMIQLGRLVERMEGSVRFGLIVLVTAIVACLLQGLMPTQYLGNPFFGGLSGVVYGVFGFLLIKTQMQPHLGIRLSSSSVMIMLGWLVLGFTGSLGPVANLAHLGGFLGGILLSYLSSLDFRR